MPLLRERDDVSRDLQTRIVAALAAEPRNADEALGLAEQASAIAHQALQLVESTCR